MSNQFVWRFPALALSCHKRLPTAVPRVRNANRIRSCRRAGVRSTKKVATPTRDLNGSQKPRFRQHLAQRNAVCTSAARAQNQITAVFVAHVACVQRRHAVSGGARNKISTKTAVVCATRARSPSCHLAIAPLHNSNVLKWKTKCGFLSLSILHNRNQRKSCSQRKSVRWTNAARASPPTASAALFLAPTLRARKSSARSVSTPQSRTDVHNVQLANLNS